MPLSITVLCLTDILLELSSRDAVSSAQHDVSGFNIAEEDVARVCVLIAGAISSCSENSTETSSNDGRVAVLSCALTRMMSFAEEAAYSVFSSTPQILEIYANAVVTLFHLSTAAVFDSEERRLQNAHEAKRGSIALAARSGLSSLFGHLKAIEHQDVSELFCAKIFTIDVLCADVLQLVQLITLGDNDVAYLLQQIALFRDGVQLLARSGVTTKLLEFATTYLRRGVDQIKPPSLLNGHLSVIITLLSSPLNSSDRVALAGDSYQLLKAYSTTFERVFQTYPSNSDLAFKFVEAAYLTYTALKEATGSNLLGKPILNDDDSLLIVERSILRLACHLSAFPFPQHLLPPLPMDLLNIEKIHASMNNVAFSLRNESTWWDNLAETKLPVSYLMPSPPTGSFDVVTQQNGRAADTTWSEREYQYAISSAKFLEVSIMFLLCRMHFVAQRDMSTFSIDAVAIAKGICRCSDASRAIQDRLNIISRPEADMTKMLDASHIINESPRDQQLSQALILEREYLLQLGSSLGECAEKLVCLSLQEARRMSSKPENSREWAYFIRAMTPALDHTEIETKVSCG
jgi:hypothetical protein